MKNETSQWVNKAEDDFRVAERELRVSDLPSYDAICFHSQQCAEKYLKAFLTEHSTVFPPTHALVDLLTLCLPLAPDFNSTCLALSHIWRFSRTWNTKSHMWRSVLRAYMATHGFFRTNAPDVAASEARR